MHLHVHSGMKVCTFIDNCFKLYSRFALLNVNISQKDSLKVLNVNTSCEEVKSNECCFFN